MKHNEITFTDEITSTVEYVDTRKCVFVHKWGLESFPFVVTRNRNQERSMEFGNDAPGRARRDEHVPLRKLRRKS